MFALLSVLTLFLRLFRVDMTSRLARQNVATMLKILHSNCPNSSICWSCLVVSVVWKAVSWAMRNCRVRNHRIYVICTSTLARNKEVVPFVRKKHFSYRYRCLRLIFNPVQLDGRNLTVILRYENMRTRASQT